jgi:hypothetical protein
MTELMKLSRELKGRIRAWVAAEVRGRMSEAPPEEESIELQEAWHEYLQEIAHQISPKGEPKP